MGFVIEDFELKFNKSGALFNISKLNVENDGVYILQGPNGSGKSSLLKIISGLDKNNKCVKFTNGLSYDDVAYCSASPCVMPTLSVLDNLFLVSNDIDKINYYIDKFKLTKLINKKASHISKGQQQRLTIIRTLLLNKKIYLFDEPTAHIDDELNDIFFEVIKEDLSDKIVIISTHEEVSNIDEYSLIEIRNNKVEILDKSRIGNIHEYHKRKNRVNLKLLFKSNFNIFKFFLYFVIFCIEIILISLSTFVFNSRYDQVEKIAQNNDYMFVTNYKRDYFCPSFGPYKKIGTELFDYPTITFDSDVSFYFGHVYGKFLNFINVKEIDNHPVKDDVMYFNEHLKVLFTDDEAFIKSVEKTMSNYKIEFYKSKHDLSYYGVTDILDYNTVYEKTGHIYELFSIYTSAKTLVESAFLDTDKPVINPNLVNKHEIIYNEKMIMHSARRFNIYDGFSHLGFTYKYYDDVAVFHDYDDYLNYKCIFNPYTTKLIPSNCITKDMINSLKNNDLRLENFLEDSFNLYKFYDYQYINILIITMLAFISIILLNIMQTKLRYVHDFNQITIFKESNVCDNRLKKYYIANFVVSTIFINGLLFALNYILYKYVLDNIYVNIANHFKTSYHIAFILLIINIFEELLSLRRRLAND
jgi:ABC-type multidrug transport system ATPase subunit